VLDVVFDLSYPGLPDAHQLLFRRLGLVFGPEVDYHMGAALMDTGPAVAAGLLEDLVDHNLLAPHVPGRYRLHDLLRQHARDLATRDNTGAITDLRAALQIFQARADRRSQAPTLMILGEARALARDHNQALHDLGQALELFQQLGEPVGQAGALAIVDRVYGMAGDHTKALRDLRPGP
jgi:hypothetical protein